MPLNSSQLAELVTRARHKAVTSPPPPPSPAPQRPVRSRQAAPVSQAPSTARIEPRSGALTLQPNDAVAPPALSPSPRPSRSAGCSGRTPGASIAGSTPSSSDQWGTENTAPCSSRSASARPSTSARTAGASRCRETAERCPSVPPLGGSSPSCPRTGSRQLDRQDAEGKAEHPPERGDRACGQGPSPGSRCRAW